MRIFITTSVSTPYDLATFKQLITNIPQLPVFGGVNITNENGFALPLYLNVTNASQNQFIIRYYITIGTGNFSENYKTIYITSVSDTVIEM